MTNSNSKYDPRKTIKGKDPISNALVICTQKGYSDKIYCGALDQLKDKNLSIKQLMWVLYWGPSNHTNCQKQVEQFIKFRINNTDEEITREQMISIIETYRRPKNSKYVDGIIQWLSNFYK